MKRFRNLLKVALENSNAKIIKVKKKKDNTKNKKASKT